MKILTDSKKENSTSTLFQKFVDLCGLSSIFASNSMRRVCKRAGVDPENFSKSDIQKVLLILEPVLALYLSQEEADKKIALLQSLEK